jgi:hypothetical protein
LFGVQRFTAGFAFWQFSSHKIKESGVKTPHSKKSHVKK